jgi:excinuclease ABC subunit C
VKKGPDFKSFKVLDLKAELDDQLRLCPSGPGVYLMRSAEQKIIYVGKAKNLKSRVRSYFQDFQGLNAKTQALMSRVESLEFFEAGSEVEALLLENTLIKRHRPKYNIRLKDDKTYPYLKLDKTHPFPRPSIARRQVAGDGAEYFGPFPAGQALRRTLWLAAKIFQLRDCRDHEFSNRVRPCLSFEIGQCTAPCVGKVDAKTYGSQVKAFVDFLKSGSSSVESEIEAQMLAASEALDFERAALLRDRLQAIREITAQDQRVVDTSDLGDRDLWAFYPPLGSLESGQLQTLVLSVRQGKLVGQSFRSADLSEKLESEDFWTTLILEHYLKHEVPAVVVLGPELEASGLAEALGLALQERLRAQRSESGAADGEEVGKEEVEVEEVTVEFASQRESNSRLYALADQNIRAHFDSQLQLQARREDSLLALKKLLDLEVLPVHLECVDVSHFQGEANVASCVVFMNGQPDKSMYRHYKILGAKGGDDFASLRELMSRRYGKPDSPRPDLLVIDGGRGQLSAAKAILDELGARFPVVSLAKARTQSDFQNSELESSEERLFRPNQKNPILLRDAKLLKLLTHMRNEAHRFAIEFHRLKRSQNRGLN